jgi:hypothetical protein
MVNFLSQFARKYVTLLEMYIVFLTGYSVTFHVPREMRADRLRLQEFVHSTSYKES